MGGQPGPSRRPGRGLAGVDPARGHRDPAGGAAAAAGPPHRRHAGGDRGQLAHPRRAAGRPRRPVGGQRRRPDPAGRGGRATPGPGRGLRRAPDAGRAGRPARRAVGLHRRARLHRAPSQPAGRGHDLRLRDHRRRRDHLRLHRDRRPALGEHERGGGRHAECGRLRPAVGRGARPRGGGRLDAAGHRDRPGGDDRGRASRRSPSGRATSRSASASPTSAWGRWPRWCPTGWRRRRRGR